MNPPTRTTSINTHGSAAPSRILFYALLGVAILPILGEIGNSWHGGNRYVDDAYYYLVIARNLANEGILSFDSLHATNGFHPLWLGLLALSYYLTGTGITDFVAQIAIAKAGEACLYVCMVGYLLYRSYRAYATHPLLSWGLIAICFVLAYPYVHYQFFIGMENTLSACLLVLVVDTWWRKKYRALAYLFPLLLLSRLDTSVFIILPLWLMLLLDRKCSFHRWFATGIPTGLVLAVYLCLNQFYFGHITPISGALKSSFPALSVHGSYLGDPLCYAMATGKYYFPLLAPNLLIFTLVGLGLLIACVRLPQAPWKGQIAGILVLIVFQIANLLLFQKWSKGVEWWYWTPLVILTAFALGVFAGHRFTGQGPWENLPRKILLAGCAVFGLFHLSQLPQNLKKRGNEDPLYDFMKSKTDPNDVFAVTDAGGIAFWTARKVINLDGLVNDFHYQAYLGNHALAQYLKDQQVDYLITSAFSHNRSTTCRPLEPMYQHTFAPCIFDSDTCQLPYFVYSYLHHHYSDTLWLSPSQEVFRSVHLDPKSSHGSLVFALP